MAKKKIVPAPAPAAAAPPVEVEDAPPAAVKPNGQTILDGDESVKVLIEDDRTGMTPSVLRRAFKDNLYYLQGKDFLADTERPSRSWLETYIPPEDQLEVLAVIREAIRSKSMFELEHRVIRADGTLGWMHSRALPLLGGGGEIVEWLGAASDITYTRSKPRNPRAA